MNKIPHSTALSRDGFLTRLMNSRTGEAILSEHLREHVEQRRQAAAILDTENRDSQEAVKLDREIVAAQNQLTQLTEQLFATQTLVGDLGRKLNAAKDKQLRKQKEARRFLEATAPPELLRFISFVRYVEQSARFRLRGKATYFALRSTEEAARIGSANGPISETVTATDLLARAQAVAKRAQGLLRKADVSATDVAQLYAELNAPGEMLDVWFGRDGAVP